MPGGFLSGSVATPSYPDQAFPTSVLPVSNDETLLNPPRNSYFRRSVRATYDLYLWTSLWPSGSFMSGSPSSPMSIQGDDSAFGGFKLAYEMSSTGIQGNQSIKFIKGTCYDSVGNPVSDATVDAFITATNVLAGTAQSNADGTYAVGTNNLSSVQHYLTAYKAGSPDIAGTSVNTLLPTNIDGT